MKPLLFLLCWMTTLATAAPLPLVTGNDYAPFTDERLPQRGMVTEIVELVFKEMHYDVQVTFRPWKRGYEETKKGIFAATFPYIKTDERLQAFYYSEPITTIPTRIFVTNRSPIRKLDDLQGRRICIPLGYGINKELNTMLRRTVSDQLGSPVDLEGCLRQMIAGRKDFFILNEISGWMAIQNTFQSKDDFRTLDTVFASDSHHLIISKSYPNAEKILADFNQGIANLRQTGRLQQIVDRHLRDIIN